MVKDFISKGKNDKLAVSYHYRKSCKFRFVSYGIEIL